MEVLPPSAFGVWVVEKFGWGAWGWYLARTQKKGRQGGGEVNEVGVSGAHDLVEEVRANLDVGEYPIGSAHLSGPFGHAIENGTTGVLGQGV